MERARELLNTRVTALVSESYERAYRGVVLTQQVVELEEVLHFKMLMREGKEGWEEECKHLREMWSRRLRGVQVYLLYLSNVFSYRQNVFSYRCYVFSIGVHAPARDVVHAPPRRAGTYSQSRKCVLYR
jgi:hypothetical protein